MTLESTRTATDKIEQMIDSIGFDLSPAELAECFYRTFNTDEIRLMGGAERVLGAYFTMMIRLHARIDGSKDAKAFYCWMQENDYWLEWADFDQVTKIFKLNGKTNSNSAMQIAEVISNYRDEKRYQIRRKVETYFRNDIRITGVIQPQLEISFPWLGERPATENDFLECCKRHGVRVTFSPEIRDGVYVYWPYNDSHHIFLNSDLAGPKLRFVMFHELAHYFFHEPSRTLQGGLRCPESEVKRKNMEADIVSAMCNLGPR